MNHEAKENFHNHSHVNLGTSQVADILWTRGKLRKCKFIKLFSGGLAVKNPPSVQETQVRIPGLGRFPGKENGNPLKYSCLVHEQRSLVGYSPWGLKSRAQLSD